MDNIKMPEVKAVDITLLKPYGNNAKNHPQPQIDDIVNLIKEFGWDVPIVLLTDNTILKGHGRYLAAKQMGLTHVPCIYNPLEENKAKAARLGDNKAGETSYDYDKIREEFEALIKAEIDLALTAFNMEEIDNIINAWKPDLEKIDATDENSDGMSFLLKVKGPTDYEEAVKIVLIRALEENDIKDVTIN